MPIPSFDDDWTSGKQGKPRVQVLEIRDREQPAGKPIAWLMVERQETCRRDTPNSPVYEASIRLTYELVTLKSSLHKAAHGDFSGRFSMFHEHGAVALSSGGVFLDLPGLDGQRIGTYLMNEIVTWVKRWPEASVNSVTLRAEQAHDLGNKERRNQFWEQFGLVFDYDDPRREAGCSRPMLAKDLNQVETWKQNITEWRMHDYLADVLHANQMASWEVDRLNTALRDSITEIRCAEAKPVRWAVKMLYNRFGGLLAGGAALAVLVVALWVRYP